MNANVQTVCQNLGIVVIDRTDAGNFTVYGLPEVKITDSVVDAMELAFQHDFTHQEIVITKKARTKKDA